MMQTVSANALDNFQPMVAYRGAEVVLSFVMDVYPGLLIIENERSNEIASAIDALTIGSLPNFRLEGPAALVTHWLAALLQTPGLTSAQN